MDKYILMDTIKKLFVRGKGVLAMDESHKTLKKRYTTLYTCSRVMNLTS